jgi:DNA helicase II / ATP-dependent DNA helicase PcrA
MTYTLETRTVDGTSTVLEATDEQTAIIDYALQAPPARRNLLIRALPGTAKTTTLRFLAKYISVEPTLSLAFNKRAADEMARVLPVHFRSATVNSIGHRAWSGTIGRRLTVDTKKTYNLVKAHLDALPRRERTAAYDLFGDITKTISRAKLNGYVPEGAPGRTLLTAETFFDGLEEAPDDWLIGIIDKVLTDGITQSYSGLVDFDDQIYMPTLFGGTWPTYARVMGDEAQDFNPLNQAMIEKLVGPDTWLACVGDHNQSIYAFRGADTNSMTWLRHRFDMHEMPLSISFRCPIAVVRNAQKRTPHMRWPAWAKEGTVRALHEWSAADIPDNSAIICRNNAPLMACALALLRARRGVHLVGTDLGPQLMRTLKKLSDNMQLPQAEVLLAIDGWQTTKLAKTRNSAAVIDKADCLRVFAGFGPTLGAAIAVCEHLFEAQGPIQLLSGHKAKGLEYDTVFHLDPHRIPSPWAKSDEAFEQELNVRYVIETRSRDSLFFVRLDHFQEP